MNKKKKMKENEPQVLGVVGQNKNIDSLVPATLTGQSANYSPYTRTPEIIP